MSVILWMFSWWKVIRQFLSFTTFFSFEQKTVFHRGHIIYDAVVEHSSNSGEKTGARGVHTERMNNEHTLFSHWAGSAQ